MRMRAKKLSTIDWYVIRSKPFRGNHWIRKEDYVYNCKYCGAKIKFNERGTPRKYCPRPKSCRELAYQKRKRKLLQKNPNR